MGHATAALSHDYRLNMGILQPYLVRLLLPFQLARIYKVNRDSI